MSERLIPEEELVEKVFAKGMLVHGFDSVWIEDALKNGIKPTALLRNPLGVCFAMLSEYDDPWDRYHNAKHQGATNDFSSDVGILISPDYLLKNHSGELVAIGCFYRSLARGGKAADIGREFNFPVNREARTVHNIPIRDPKDFEASWDDEIRLYCADETQRIPASAWSGIVVAQKTLPRLYNIASIVGYRHSTPVFDTDLKIITYDLSKEAIKNLE